MYEDLKQFKIFMNLIDFSCMIFWAQNVLIPPNCMLLPNCISRQGSKKFEQSDTSHTK